MRATKKRIGKKAMLKIEPDLAWWFTRIERVGFECSCTFDPAKKEFEVNLRFPHGRRSIGTSQELLRAFESAASGMLDWHSLDRRLTEDTWLAMSRL